MRLLQVFAVWTALLCMGSSAADLPSTSCMDLFLGGLPPQAGGPIICKAGYAMAPLPGALVPAWSAEHLTAASVADAEAAPRFGSFHVERDLPPEERSTNADYAGSGYDKGHMTPVGDFGDQAEEFDTFSLGNMVPQRPQLNRFVWQDIEAKARQLASTQGEAWIVTGPIVTIDAPRLKGRVAVPSKTWKAIETPRGVMGVYIATNTATPDCRILTVDAAIAEIGFDPLPGRPVMMAVKPPANPARKGSAGCRPE